MNPPLLPTLEIVPWVDHEIERYGFLPQSPYVETVYLPVLGPTATLLYRRLGMWAGLEPDGFTLETADLSASMGIGVGIGRQSPLARSLGRMAQFGVAEWQQEKFAVRRALAPLSEKHAQRLPASAWEAHRSMLAQLVKGLA